MQSSPFESVKVNFSPGCLKIFAVNVCSETEIYRSVNSKTNQYLVVHSYSMLKFNLACEIHM